MRKHFRRWAAQSRQIAQMERQAAAREARIEELAERLMEQGRVRIESDARHVETREHLEATVALLGEKVRATETLLTQIHIAVGRVKVLEGQVSPGFDGLPELVSLIVSDHEDLEARFDAVVDYLKKLGPSDEHDPMQIRQEVARLIQGAEPEIIDLQDSNEIIKEV